MKAKKSDKCQTFFCFDLFALLDCDALLRCEKPEVIAPTWQTSLHLPQRIHSAWFASRMGLICMGQAFSHCLQSVHVC